MLPQLLALGRRAVQSETEAARTALHDAGCVYPQLLRRLAQAFGPALSELRALDFGCGYSYPLLVLLEGQVREVVGVDVSPVFRDGLLPFILAGDGLKRPGTLLERMIAYRVAARYHRHLQRLAGEPRRHEGYRILQYDGRRLPFDAGSFDVVVSNAVLQELPLPLERYAAEMARVLRPGGRIDLEWHSFYSWSGHYLGPEESARRPWGHLLGGRFDPSLNRVTPNQVLEAYAPCFEELSVTGHDARCRLQGIDPEYEPEGAAYLTPELEARLADYPRGWLLTRGYVLRGRVRQPRS